MKRAVIAFAILLLVFVQLSTVTPAHSAQAPDPIVVRFLSGRPFAVSGFAPGDETQWAVELRNTGVKDAAVVIHTTVSGTGAFATHDTHGIHVVFDTCPGLLSPVLSDRGARTFACAEQPTVLPTILSGSGLVGSVVVRAGRATDLRAVFSFIGSSGNDFENATPEIVLMDGTRKLTPLVQRPPKPSSPAFEISFIGADIGSAALFAAGLLGVGLLVLAVVRRRGRSASVDGQAIE